MRVVVATLTIAFALLVVGCPDSPVPADKTVHVRGTAQGISLLELVNTTGMSSRSASVGEDGSFDFAWTGKDLSGMFGERKFQLEAPADPDRTQPWIGSETFSIREDVDLGALQVWDPQESVKVVEGGLQVAGFQAPGEGFQKIARIELVIRYTQKFKDQQGAERENTTRATRELTSTGLSLSASELETMLSARVRTEVEVELLAHGSGGAVALAYHGGWQTVSLPLP